MIDDAITALRELTKCTCHPSYSGRGLEDPNCLHHAHAEYVEDLAARVGELEAEVKRLRGGFGGHSRWRTGVAERPAEGT